jgi:asparagine synthase (glutamine-hydrolysing)
MTAIAGLWRFDGQPDAAESCIRMLSSQQLYGPHASAHWSDGDVAFGRRLMRVLPEDALDRQPLVGANGRYILVADIRLDNRDALQEALDIPLASAQQLSDAALLLAAIERWEETYLERLIGDYAFALWDCRRRRLELVRDPLGQRPLHYHRSDRFFAFASMPKGLHALPEIHSVPDEERIAELLILLPDTGARSFFHGIERVEPGHVVTVTPNGLAARRHWRPTRSLVVLRREEEYDEALRDLLNQAVRCRLRGVKDAGAHLSGGLDSAAVASTAARLLAPLGRRVIAFTAVPRKGYDGAAPRNRIINEGPYAAATAALYSNMEHVLIHNGKRSPLDDLDRSFFLYEQPVLNICNIGWIHSIYDAAKSLNLDVLLTGGLGNFGLSYSGMELLPELLRRGRLVQLWREMRALVRPGGMRWRGALAETFGPWCPATLWVWLNQIATGYARKVNDYSAIHPQRFADLDLRARAKARGLDLTYRPWKDGFSMRLFGLSLSDPGNYNKGVLGGWQIDERDPTADIRLLEFCFAVPTDKFLSGGRSRALARRALADRLPKLVLEEPRKGLQAADWHEQLTAVRDRVGTELDRFDACPAATKVLDLPRLRGLVKNWPPSGWESDDVCTPYRLALLRGISAGHFLRKATGAN